MIMKMLLMIIKLAVIMLKTLSMVVIAVVTNDSCEYLSAHGECGNKEVDGYVCNQNDEDDDDDVGKDDYGKGADNNYVGNFNVFCDSADASDNGDAEANIDDSSSDNGSTGAEYVDDEFSSLN